MKTYEKLINKLKTQLTGSMSDDVEKVFKVLCEVIDEDKPWTESTLQLEKSVKPSWTSNEVLEITDNINYLIPVWQQRAIEKGYRKGIPTKEFIDQHYKKRGGFWSYSSSMATDDTVMLDVENDDIYFTYYGGTGRRVKIAVEGWPAYFIPLNKYKNHFEDPMKAWTLKHKCVRC